MSARIPAESAVPGRVSAQCRAVLLCSDGFWEYITEAEMIELLNISSSADDWLMKMVSVVKKNGQLKNMDNYSAIAILNPNYK